MLERIKSNMSLPPQYFQKLVESCPDIIIAVDQQGTITFYNDGASRIWVFHRKKFWEKTSWRFILISTKRAG